MSFYGALQQDFHSDFLLSALQIELSDAADAALLREPGNLRSLIGLQVPKKDAQSIWGSVSRVFTSVWQRNVGIFMN